jgi:hypothetical protein
MVEGEVDFTVDQAKHVIEGVVALFKIDEGCGGKAPGAELMSGKNSGRGEAFRIFVRVGIEENTIDDAKNGGGSTNAEGESKNGDGGERRRFAELTQCEPAIGKYRVKPIPYALFADLLFDLFNTAEFDARRSSSFVRRHAGSQVLFREHFQVGMNLPVEVHFRTPGKKKVPQETPNFEQEGHTTPL